MNQKIKDLALQCYNPYSNFDHELFAKLIVEDIIESLHDQKNFNRCVHTNFDLDRARCIVSDLSKKIREDYL